MHETSDFITLFGANDMTYIFRSSWEIVFIFSTSFDSNFTHYKVRVMFKRWKVQWIIIVIFCINCELIPTAARFQWYGWGTLAQ